MEYSRRDIAALAGLGLAGLASQSLAQRTHAPTPFVPGDVQHRRIQVNGISLHVAEKGTGPLVLLCHPPGSLIPLSGV